MAKRTHRKHSAEFKFRLVLEVLKGERTRAEIASEHNITKSLLYKWEQKFLEQGNFVFQSNEQHQSELRLRDERIAELERLVGEVTYEKSILKKAGRMRR